MELFGKSSGCTESLIKPFFRPFPFGKVQNGYSESDSSVSSDLLVGGGASVGSKKQKNIPSSPIQFFHAVSPTAESPNKP